MTLKEVFISNLRKYRKNEGFSQMKLAELCNTAPSYIGQIETGRKFPSMEMIERMADILKIEPYYFFKKQKDNTNLEIENLFPKLPNSMKTQIKSQIKAQFNLSTIEILNEVLDKY